MTNLVGELPGKDGRAIPVSANDIADIVLVGIDDIWVGVEKIMVVRVLDVFDIEVHATKIVPITR